MFLHDYYVKHFERKNLLTNELLPFKNKDSYFELDFENISQLYKWCEIASAEIVGYYIKEKLISRIKSKELKFAPNEIELYTSQLPSINIYKKLFKSYTYLCDDIGIKPLFSEKLPDYFWKDSFIQDLTILTDTREQEPLYFKKQIVQKLDVGDYAILDYFDYTFVDRKSEQDFKSTLSKDNLERFKKELDRCRTMGCYLFVVVDADLTKLEETNKKSAHKSNMKYIYHNMRLLQHEYRDCCQFVFSGSRVNSENLIPRILKAGKKIWNVDLQFFINNKPL
jgi:hypothetical protein